MAAQTMTTCTHEIWERETAAVADGMCPQCLAIRVTELKAAIRWALGEQADDRNEWFGQFRQHAKLPSAPYWWRTNLRRMANLEQEP